MVKIKKVVLLFSLLTLFSLTAGITTSDDKLIQAPEGYVIIEEDDWAYFMEDPAFYLKKGRENFQNNDLKSAALDLMKGAIFLKAEASRATGEAGRLLRESAAELQALAKSIEQGSVRSVSRIDKTISRAYYALSVHYYEIAKEARLRNEFKKVGRRISASSYYLERALLRSGQKAETATRNVMSQALGVAYKIFEGTGWTVAEVGRSMSELGKEIEKAGARIQKKE
ncbi:MAG: hypothetical protein JSV25_04865 [Spirochaetota bacterium]|nr:MAG: hypothetical protein JSV25_04865 [Spirochaetota bacterium]